MIPRLSFFLLLLTHLCATAQESVDSDINNIIRKIGMEESQVMELASWITDVYGPRLTGSPMLDRASDWAVSTLKSWKMQNVHLEEWGPFGRGWEAQHMEMHCTLPSYFPLIAYPKAWSGSTPGAVTSEVIYLNAGTKKELKSYEGKLTGKFVLLDTIRNVKEWYEPSAERVDSEGLLKLANKRVPPPFKGRSYRASGSNFVSELWSFLEKEKPAAVLDRNFKGDLGTVFVAAARTAEGPAWESNQEIMPQVTIAIEHYNRIFRLLQKGIPVTLMFDLNTTYANPDRTEHNIIAEIKGTDLADEYVIFGAHFDSWHSATGATDNGAGSAVMMEVARILTEVIKESGIKPRRTLRLALWTGEEQGILGSRAYVRSHFADTDPSGNPKKIFDAQKTISGYFNFDNGTGRIRGVHLQGNSEVMPIFRDFMDPFQDLGATTLSLGNTGGTDHTSFDQVGIPGFQFIQDPIAYNTKTHHSNMDNWDHLEEEDLKQAATIIASFVWHTSQRDEMLPRKRDD